MIPVTLDEWDAAFASIGGDLEALDGWEERAARARSLVFTLGQLLHHATGPGTRSALARSYARAYRLHVEADRAAHPG